MGVIGILLSLPSMVLFFVLWTAVSLIRPAAFVTILCLLANPTATLKKMQLFVNTVQYLAFCNDKKWKSPKEDPASFFPQDRGSKTDKKTIIFVRHGESTWNDTFNKGNRSQMSFVLNFIPNLIWAALVEWYLFVSGEETESWFYDSPLSEKGKKQAEGVRDFLEKSLEYSTPREQELIRLMLGEAVGADKEPSSQLVSSNLRRAISTVAIGFQDRLEKKLPNDSILIIPALQEISRNPDALSIVPPKGKVPASWTDRHLVEEILANQCDTSMHTGNKPVNTNGLKRMEEFCHLVFTDIKKENLIVGGHSLWFRSFFRTYLPHSVEHVSKKNKLVNGGCVGFTLERIKTDKGYKYMIDPRGITVLHGGF